MTDAATGLTLATVDMNSMAASVPSGDTLQVELNALQVMSYSSSFWVADMFPYPKPELAFEAAGIVEDKVKYALGKGSLSKGTLGRQEVFVGDGKNTTHTLVVTIGLL